MIPTDNYYFIEYDINRLVYLFNKTGLYQYAREIKQRYPWVYVRLI